MPGKEAQGICAPLPRLRQKASSRSELADHVRKDWIVFHSEKSTVEKEKAFINCERKTIEKLSNRLDFECGNYHRTRHWSVGSSWLIWEAKRLSPLSLRKLATCPKRLSALSQSHLVTSGTTKFLFCELQKVVFSILEVGTLYTIKTRWEPSLWIFILLQITTDKIQMFIYKLTENKDKAIRCYYPYNIFHEK